eukprot:496386-Amphidinium_carterae.1
MSLPEDRSLLLAVPGLSPSRCAYLLSSTSPCRWNGTGTHSEAQESVLASQTSSARCSGPPGDLLRPTLLAPVLPPLFSLACSRAA